MTTQEHVYRIIVVEKVVDGDTYRLRLDVGFYLTALVKCRLLGWDCPELHGPTEHERTEARAAMTVAEGWLNAHPDRLWVRTQKDDSFGRWVGDIWTDMADGSALRLGEALASLQLATPWPTRWRDTYGTV